MKHYLHLVTGNRMKRITLILLWFLTGVFVVFMYYNLLAPSQVQPPGSDPNITDSEEVVLVSVVCGSGPNFKEFLTLVKSAILFQTSSRIRFIVVSDFSMHSKLDEKLQDMKRFADNSFTYQLLNTSSFPETNSKEFKKFEEERPCASQRLFFPNVLKDENYVLYLDTDTIFLNELSTMWQNVHCMNVNHVAGLVMEFEDPKSGFYAKLARKNKYPIFKKQGLNSGVMFMALNKMREFRWVDRIAQIISQYGSKFIFHDQDVINIFFHTYPDRLYVAPCTCNYRPPHCRHKDDCPGAEKKGVSLIHGAGGFFQIKNRWNPFYHIYETFAKYELGTDPYTNLVRPLERKIRALSHLNCRHRINAFLKNLYRLYPKSPHHNEQHR